MIYKSILKPITWLFTKNALKIVKRYQINELIIMVIRYRSPFQAFSIEHILVLFKYFGYQQLSLTGADSTNINAIRFCL